MGSVTMRYFFADDPSPITPMIERLKSARSEMYHSAKAVAAMFGAEPACTQDRMKGLLFKEKPPADKYTLGGYFEDSSNAWYRPRGNSKGAREGRAAIDAIRAAYTKNQILRDLSLYTIRFDVPRYFESSIGWKAGRVFVAVPFTTENCTGEPDCDGPNLRIPDWLSECTGWEMDKWFAQSNASVPA